MAEGVLDPSWQFWWVLLGHIVELDIAKGDGSYDEKVEWGLGLLGFLLELWVFSK